jgi:hypothetical protein
MRHILTLVADRTSTRLTAAMIRRVGEAVRGSDPAILSEGGEKTKKKKAASKTRYICPDCGLNAWAKPGVLIGCIECEKPLEAEEEGR